MRASAVVAIVCLATQVALSCAAPIGTRKVVFQKPNIGTLALATASQYAFNVISSVLTTGVWKGISTPAPAGNGNNGTHAREVLEFLDTRINEELAARAYTQELLSRVPKSGVLDDLN
ncbi:hypothetical protein BJV78DRAFT_1282893 [Lactifluus subvellereus]|nr:hypothetical protein BJV78DRAFT_1282893 [Lactifluus subvellereus]